MAQVEVRNEQILIDGRPTYEEISGSRKEVHGLLMNARFIQGIFDDKADPARFSRFGVDRFDPERNTDKLIAALPEWYEFGLRAITVGLQGGMPVFTIENSTIDNNPFSEDGTAIDQAYLSRLDRLIRAADRIGMVIIVSILYEGQNPRMKDGQTVRNAVATASRFLSEQGYPNVIIEVANEHNVGRFRDRPLVYYPDGAAWLVDLARNESGGSIPIGCSPGATLPANELAGASDIIFIHGNGKTRQQYYQLVENVRAMKLNKPIVCNEDSPCYSRVDVSVRSYASWGYYNNLTKQEPPPDWRVQAGEDTFFARRVAKAIGIHVDDLSTEQQYHFHGFEEHLTSVDGGRWIRVACEYPETVDYIEYFRSGERVALAYDEPFFINYRTTWIQDAFEKPGSAKEWKAIIHRADGTSLEIDPVNNRALPLARGSSV